MTLTRELRTSAACVVAVALVLTALVWGNQRHAQAQIVDVGQILCLVDEAGDANDGNTGTFPVFSEQDCTDQGGIVKDWCPNIPGDQEQGESCIPPETDQCTNIDGIQATVPDGMVRESGECVEQQGGGGNGGGGSSSDLSLTKTVSDASPTPSSTITYTIAVHNAGPDAAQNVSVTDTLPGGVAYVSDNGGGAYVSSTGVWTVGTVASDATTTLVIIVTNEAVSGTAVKNSASVTHSDSSDSNSGNNSAEASFTSTADNQGGGGGGDAAECADSTDNDNDGQIDFPADTDCADAGDDSEAGAGVGGGGGGSGHSRRNGGSGRIIGSDNGGGEVLGAQTQQCPMFLTGYIKYGANNDAVEVAKLQVFLNAYEANDLQVTGAYDQATLAAVNAFQRKYAKDVLEPWGLQGVTGYVYYTTQKQVNTIFCKFQKDFPLSAEQLDEISYVREIQPQLRAQGITSMGTARPAAVKAEASPIKPASAPVVGSVVPSIGQTDENATNATNATSASSSQKAATSTASSAPGWFGRFVNWLFGR